jgi:hypothetical protein
LSHRAQVAKHLMPFGALKRHGVDDRTHRARHVCRKETNALRGTETKVGAFWIRSLVPSSRKETNALRGTETSQSCRHPTAFPGPVAKHLMPFGALKPMRLHPERVLQADGFVEKKPMLFGALKHAFGHRPLRDVHLDRRASRKETNALRGTETSSSRSWARTASAS